MKNRLYNCKNPYQGNYKKVICVCSAGLLRSPTIAYVLSQDPWNYNTRACGVHDYALIMIDDVLVTWADEIVVTDNEKENIVKSFLKRLNLSTPVINLKISDEFEYRNEDLIDIIKQKYEQISTK